MEIKFIIMAPYRRGGPVKLRKRFATGMGFATIRDMSGKLGCGSVGIFCTVGKAEHCQDMAHTIENLKMHQENQYFHMEEAHATDFVGFSWCHEGFRIR